MLRDIVEQSDGAFDFSMCNPPFFASMAAVDPNPFGSCEGVATELVTAGGEVAFVGRIIEESVAVAQRVRWFTSMVGCKSSVRPLLRKLRAAGITNVCTMVFVQGVTRRWGIAWSFSNDGYRVAHNGLVPTAARDGADARIFGRKKDVAESAKKVRALERAFDVEIAAPAVACGGGGGAAAAHAHASAAAASEAAAGRALLEYVHEALAALDAASTDCDYAWTTTVEPRLTRYAARVRVVPRPGVAGARLRRPLAFDVELEPEEEEVAAGGGGGGGAKRARGAEGGAASGAAWGGEAVPAAAAAAAPLSRWTVLVRKIAGLAAGGDAQVFQSACDAVQADTQRTNRKWRRRRQQAAAGRSSGGGSGGAP